MNKPIKRRDALKITAAVGGLLVLANTTPAALSVTSKKQKLANFDGSWLYQNQACAIWQHDSVLICVNEVGSLGTALMTSANSFVIQGGSGWDVGLVGEITSNSKQINWSNNTQWVRA